MRLTIFSECQSPSFKPATYVVSIIGCQIFTSLLRYGAPKDCFHLYEFGTFSGKFMQCFPPLSIVPTIIFATRNANFLAWCNIRAWLQDLNKLYEERGPGDDQPRTKSFAVTFPKIPSMHFRSSGVINFPPRCRLPLGSYQHGVVVDNWIGVSYKSDLFLKIKSKMPESRARKVTRWFKEHARVTSAGRNPVEVGIITNPEGCLLRKVSTFSWMCSYSNKFWFWSAQVGW
jgi:hypothetical protein